MRKSRIFLGGMAIIAIAGTFLLNPFSSENTETAERSYAPRTKGAEQPTVADAARELYELKRQNQQTGIFDRQEWKAAREAFLKFDRENNRAASISWEELGPDNIGGRTRAILIDVNDNNHIFAGSVSGGLFESFNGGNNWSKVDGFSDNLAISAIAQSKVAPYTIIVGTGNQREGFTGNGAYFSNDNGVTWDNVQGTSGWSLVNEVVYGTTQQKFYMSTSSGLRELDANADPATTTPNTVAGAPSGTIEGLAISPDGRVILAGRVVGAADTYVSTDYGTTWTDVGGPQAGSVASASRIEYAISHTTVNGKYYCYASCANSVQVGQFMSMSDGEFGTWVQTAPASSSGFQPFTTGSGGGQGTYDNVISVFPQNPGKVLLGGIDTYTGTEASGVMQWEQASFWFASPASPIYVHADQHEMKYDSQGWLYGGNDGGVYKSPPGTNLGKVFFPANKGYNVTQFYSVAFSKHGEVMGGTQDNGTLYNDYTNATWMEFEEVNGGDGFDCDISFIYPDVMFSTVYYGGLSRSNDRGFTWGQFFSPTLLSCGTPGGLSGGLGAFNTVCRLYENPDDQNSTDSVIFLPDSTMLPGDTAFATGYSLQNELWQILTDTLAVIDTMLPDGTVVQNGDTLNYWLNPETGDTIEKGYDDYLVNVPLDTLMIQDPVQSWFALGVGQTTTSACRGVWFTRDALKFGNTPFWWHVDLPMGGFERPSAIEFSADGNHMYVGTTGGDVYRISGIGTVYGNKNHKGYPGHPSSPTSAGAPDSLDAQVTVTQIHSGSGSVNGIGVDPQDPGHVVLAIGGFGTNIYESNTADIATGSGSFSSIQGNLPSAPCHDVIIDRLNPNLIVVGTEFGVYASDDGGSTWTDNSVDFGKTPVEAVRQSWRSWDEGNRRPGEIYIGTFGRGIWASSTYLSTPDNVNGGLTAQNAIGDLTIYPNPMAETGTVKFELNERGPVTIDIFSISGRKVKTIKAGTLAQGEHVIDLGTSDLPSGSYIATLRTVNSRKTAKFIVNK